MEVVTILWAINFSLFSLTLILLWSKMYIIAKKVKALDSLISRIESFDGK